MSVAAKLYLITALDQLCFSLAIVVFASHIFALGGSQSFMGLTASLGALASLFWNPLIGSLGDSKGRKYVLSRVILVNFLANILMVLSNSFIIITISRIFAMMAMPTLAIVRTLASEVLSESDQKLFFNKIQIVQGAAFMGGTLISGFFNGVNNGVSLVFLIASVLCLVNLGLTSTLQETVKEKKTTKDKTEDNKSKLSEAASEVVKAFNHLKSVDWLKFWDIFGIKLCYDLMLVVIQNSIGAIFIKSFEVSSKIMGFIILALSLAAMGFSFLSMYLKKTYYKDDTQGYQKLFLGSILFLTTSLGLAFAPTLPICIVSMLGMPASRIAFEGAFPESLIAKTTPAERGGVTGAFESLNSLAGLFMPIVIGIIGDTYGAQRALILNVVPGIVCLLLTNRQRKLKQN